MQDNQKIIQNISHKKDKTKLFMTIFMKYAFIYGMLIYSSFAFGTLMKFILTVVLVIWLTNVYMYFKVPVIRAESLRNARVFSSGYLITLIALQFVIKYFWGLDAQDISMSLDPSVVYASPTMGMGVINALVTVFLIASISAPAGYLIVMFQKRKHYTVPHEDKIYKRYRKF